MSNDDEKFREVDANKKPFLKKPKWFFGMFGGKKDITPKEIEDYAPLLFYWDLQGNITVYDKFTEDNIEPIDPNTGKKKGYSNTILPNRRGFMKYGDKKIPVYWLFEAEAYNYPTDVKQNAKETHKLINIIIANYKELEAKLNSGKGLTMQQVKMWLFLIGGLVGIFLIGWYLGSIFGLWEFLGQGGGATTNATANFTTNTTF